MDFAVVFVNTVFELLTLAIVARILMSWFQTSSRGALYRFMVDVTQPILNLAQKITPRTGMLDFSPLVALIGLDLLNALIIRLILHIPA